MGKIKAKRGDEVSLVEEAREMFPATGPEIMVVVDFRGGLVVTQYKYEGLGFARMEWLPSDLQNLSRERIRVA